MTPTDMIPPAEIPNATTIKLNGNKVSVVPVQRELVSRALLRRVIPDGERAYAMAAMVKASSTDYYFAAEKYLRVKEILGLDGAA